MKEKNNDKKLKILVIVLAVLLVAAVAALVIVLTGKGPAEAPAVDPAAPATEATEPTESVPEETEGPEDLGVPVETAPDAEDIEIATPFATLRYPGQWVDYLQTEQISGDVHTVKFYCRLDDSIIELFSISFGGEDGYAWMQADDGSTVAVNVVCEQIEAQPDWTDSQRVTVYTMQEGLNAVLNGLEFVQAPAANEQSVIPEDDTLADIETPYGALKYPARWSEYLITKADESGAYSVKFSAKIGEHAEEHLFTVYIGGDKGIEAGAIGDKSLRIEIAEPVLDDTWSDDESLILTAMQEDMNYLLSNLPE